MTFAVQRIILFHIIVFVAQLVLHVPFGAASPFGVVNDAVNDWLGFSVQAVKQGYLWTPLTYIFLHGGLMHLFTNVLWLYCFGPDVERALGTRQFFFFYAVCGAVAVWFTALPIPLLESGGVVLGASGAIMAVLVAFAVINPERQLMLFPIPMPINARALVIIVIVYNVLTPLVSSTSVGGAPGISVGTHLGGLAAGFAYMKIRPTLFAAGGPKKPRSKPSAKANDPVGEAVDNIFRLDDRKRGKK